MRAYLDTEFNGMGGELISLALVPEHDTLDNFYAALPCHSPVPWVAEHVIPKLKVNTVGLHVFKSLLHAYILLVLKSDEAHVDIYADWPDDFKYFCDLLITGPGEMMALPHGISFHFVDVKSEPNDPHNALSDAIALRGAVIG